MVRDMLHDIVYLPLRAEYGWKAATASAATFFASGVLHAYPILMTIGADWYRLISAIGFFMVQAVLVYVESFFKSQNSDNFEGGICKRVLVSFWVLIAVVLPAPLLIQPLVHVQSCFDEKLSLTDIVVQIMVTTLIAAVALKRSVGAGYGRHQSPYRGVRK